MSKEVEVSVIVPVLQRIDDLGTLLPKYREALEASGKTFEFIFPVDGGVHEDVVETILETTAGWGNVRVLKLSKYFGEATVLSAGFDAARGDLILTLPAYFQVEPKELPALFDSIEQCDMLLTQRSPRQESRFGQFRRSAFHGLLGFLSGERFHDLGCGVRLFRRKIADEVSLYGDLHRFLPVLASKQGFVVREIELPQSDQDEFRGTYRLREYLHRILDILTVFFLVRFTKKPLRFFGMIGGGAVLVGGFIVLLTVFQRIFMDLPLADRPALLLGSLLLVLGVQTIALGLIGELIIFTHAGAIKEYKIREIINAREDMPEPDRATG